MGLFIRSKARSSASSRIAPAVALGLAVAALSLQGLIAFAGSASPKLSPELERVRDQLAKYKDPFVAVRDGYHSTVGCVHYKDGAMGVHFLNKELLGPRPDPNKPQILVYEPVGDRLELVAAEWFIPLATGVDKRPTLFGQPFDGPMEGHEPLIPQELHHYDLHVWLFKENPKGLFHAVNPNVSCSGYGYAVLEEPTAIVTHHTHHHRK
jgi:hypothetical protein